MFKPYERDPFASLSEQDWARLRDLLSDHDRCFPQFAGRIELADVGTDTAGRRKPFPVRQWSYEEEELLIRSGAVEPQRWETDCAHLVPACRLAYVRDRFFAGTRPTLICTDFPDNLEQRVFPWADEAEVLLSYIETAAIAQPLSVLNIFCGAGTVAISIGRTWTNTHLWCSDINPRALKYVDFNTSLNDVNTSRSTPLVAVQSDILANISDTFDLILGIPPMALQPPGEESVEHLHSAGGPLGSRVVSKLLRDCEPKLNPGGRLVFLSYGLGRADGVGEPSDLVNTLESTGLSGTWKIVPLPNEKVWRLGEDKRFTNPMPVQYMISRLADPIYRSSHIGDYELWERWIQGSLLEELGFTHLHYVIVDYTAPSRE